VFIAILLYFINRPPAPARDDDALRPSRRLIELCRPLFDEGRHPFRKVSGGCARSKALSLEL
jgi:hypothetical protein